MMDDKTPKDALPPTTPPGSELPGEAGRTAETAAPAPDAGTSGTKRSGLRRARWLPLSLLLVAIVALVSVEATSSSSPLGLSRLLATVPVTADNTEAAVAEPAVVAAPAEPATYTFNDLDIHPANLFTPYIPAGRRAQREPGLAARSSYHAQFGELLDIYEKRQGVDDNFTIRVIDNRTNEVLELFTLNDDRERFNRTGQANWGAIDQRRRAATNDLVQKYIAKGIPRQAVTARWGRANQVKEARQREEAFIEYEIRLARKLGLSLLATEIGTVETFNEDHLVSPVGARSRYQLMPDMLRRLGLHQYNLPTAGPRNITVREELHALLSMEPSFIIVRGFTNAVGHEIPGISAYHTGPGNIFNLYNIYLNNRQRQTEDPTVIDAYMWAVTDGFPIVSSNSTFRNHSRGYVPSTYGSLRAMENSPIDPTRTLRVERVQLATGQEILLSRLLSVLEPYAEELDWGFENNGPNLYERFRALNPHFMLPPALENTPETPTAGNVRLQRAVGQARVRFFLPLGASETLKRAGLNILDEDSIFRYDEFTYQDTELTGQKTEWDRAYEELVNEVKQFGFSHANRTRLIRLIEQFNQMHEENPTTYRRLQLQIARMHHMAWTSPAWARLASTVSAS